MKNLLNNNLTLFGLILILGCGCKKIKGEPPNCNNPDSSTVAECLSFPPPPELGYAFIETGEQFSSPCFNPNNSNEFIYLKEEEGKLPELIKRDINTGSEMVLCSSVDIISAPQFGTNGWIVFTGVDKKIWRIDSDGNGLQQISFETSDILPHFYGDNVCYFRNRQYSNAELNQNPNLYYEYIMMLIDINGTKLDSFQISSLVPDNYYQLWHIADFYSNTVFFENFIPGQNQLGIYSLDLESEVFTEINTTYFSSGLVVLNDLEYSSDKSIYFSTHQGNLEKVDVNTGIVQTYKIGCDTHYYNTISLSAEEDMLLVEKTVSTILESGAINQQHEIWIIDLTTDTETKLL